MEHVRQCSRWTAFSCLFTHENAQGPRFIRRGASLGRNEFCFNFFLHICIMQVSPDDSSDSGLIPATQIARVQRVDVDVFALILQATAMMLYPQQSCLPDFNQPYSLLCYHP